MTRADAAKFLLNAPALLKQQNIDGWTVFVEMSGAWCWGLPDTCALYASPFWENAAGILLEYCYLPEEEGSFTAFLPFKLTGNLAYDVENYLEIIAPYLKLRPDQGAFAKGLPEIPA